MVAQFVVARITALTRNCRIACALRLAHNKVRNGWRMSRRTTIPRRLWPREKADDLYSK